MNTQELSRTISYALRHAPWEFELELDEEGWVLANDLLLALQSAKVEWQCLTLEDILLVINSCDKKRHEFKDGKIRALYGHSVTHKLIKEPASPPAVLYHGTSPKYKELIQTQGLKPMSRHYVHLSADTDTAKQVSFRKSRKPILLLIDAEKAFAEGIPFFKGNEKVWLADYIPPEFIQQIKG